MKKLFYFMIALLGLNTSAQVGVGVATANIHPSAQFEVASTNKGFLAPRMSEDQKNAIASPATGLLVYQTDAITGFYYFDGSVWKNGLGPQGPQGEIGMIGDTGPQGDKGDTGATGPQGDKGDTGAQGIQGLKGDKGEMGSQGIRGLKGDQGPQGEKGDQGPSGNSNFNTSNIAIGYVAGSLGQGEHSIAIGSNVAQEYQAEGGIGIGYAAAQGGQGENSIAIGTFAGQYNQPANSIAIGDNTANTGTNSVAIGSGASASMNTIQLGNGAITDVKTSGAVTASGFKTLTGTPAQYLMADGTVSDGTGGNFVDLTNSQTIDGYKNFTKDITINDLSLGHGSFNDSSNIAFGNNTLASNQSGTNNIAIGQNAAHNNNSGSTNVVIGNGANYYNESSSEIVAVGNGALHAEKGAGNVAVGAWAGHRGNISADLTNSVFLGRYASAGGGTIDNSVALGNGASVDASNTIQLGNTNITDVKTSGQITGAGFKTPSGTSAQYLMADGSTTTSSFAPIDSPSFSGVVTVGGASSTTSAALEVKSTTQGFLPPRMTQEQRDAISSPAQGLMLYCTDCGTNGEPEYFNGTAWVNLVGGAAQSPPPTLGRSYQGGIIFYILKSGDPGYDENTPHGLIAAMEDQSNDNHNIKWDQYVYHEIPDINDGIGYGAANTTKIINDIGSSTLYAAGLARAYRGGGYSDWYVPSQDELNQLYVNRSYFTGSTAFGDYQYWSSSQFANWAAFVQDLTYGWTQSRNRGDIAGLRAIRSF